MSLINLGGVLEIARAPLLKKLIEGRLPAPLNGLADAAIEVLAERVGASSATSEAIVDRYYADPATATKVIQDMESDPALILAGVEQQRETNRLFQAEMKEPLWAWAWRPLGMYGLGVLWFWSLIVLHLLNAVLDWSLPAPDLWLLLQLSAAYMTLYMGGHTLKDFISKKWGGA